MVRSARPRLDDMKEHIRFLEGIALAGLLALVARSGLLRLQTGA
jgi:hypothetical protein